MDHVDPPDLALRPTLRRLLPLWWEQRRLVGIGLAFALAFTTLSITIPLLIQRLVDEAIVGPHDSRLVPYLGAILVLAGLRFFVNFSRRFATARVGIAVEARLRGMLYDAYLRYPRAFFDRHATGEVISRATNDIYPVRYFIGWGVVQGIQSAMMITAAGIVLLTVNARLALISALAMPAIAVLTWFFAHRLFPISRLVQAKKGHLTEATDEAVVGIEMVQAFGRENDVRTRFLGRAEAVRHETMRAATVEANFLPGLLFLPHARDRRGALLRRPRGDRRRADDRGVHALHHAPAPAGLAARGARLDHQPRPARGRVGGAQLRVAGGDRAARRAGRAETAAGRAAAGSVRGRPLQVRDGDRGAPRRRPRGRAGRDRRGLRPDRLGQDNVARTCSPRFYDPTVGRVLVGGVDTRDVHVPELRSAVAIVTQKPVLFSVLLRENLLSARPDAGLG